VAQDVTLCPFLILIYVIGITHVSNFKSILFADDTVISFSAKLAFEKNEG